MSIWCRLWRRSPAAPATQADQFPDATKMVLTPADPLANLSAMSSAARRTTILAYSINPALGWLHNRGIPATDAARVMLLAITGQEADAQYRRQHGGGPARGLYQFERMGGCAGVLAHAVSLRHAEAICAARGVEPSATAVHGALERDDVLAAVFARLLLWTDPRALPTDENAGWGAYLRNWRPGKPHPDRWGSNWRLAIEAVRFA